MATSSKPLFVLQTTMKPKIGRSKKETTMKELLLKMNLNRISNKVHLSKKMIMTLSSGGFESGKQLRTMA